MLAGIAVRDAMRAGGALRPRPAPGGTGRSVPAARPSRARVLRGASSGGAARPFGGCGASPARVDVDAASGACAVSGSAEAVASASAAIRALIENGDGSDGANAAKVRVKREDDGDAEDGGVYGPRGDEAVALAPAAEAPPPEAPNFGLSGALAAETNTVNGVTLVYTEPVDKAPPPATKYRMYVFKDGHLLKDAEPLRVHRQSYYLFGRDRAVADIPTDHPSCSKQHAVLQYRSRSRYDDDAGLYVTESTPYLMDLEATNGTFINGERLDPRRYYQLLQKDCVKFGASTREYVLLAEDAAGAGAGRR